jgi:hypothetical protein
VRRAGSTAHVHHNFGTHNSGMASNTIQIFFLSGKVLYSIVHPRMSGDVVKHFNYGGCEIHVNSKCQV